MFRKGYHGREKTQVDSAPRFTSCRVQMAFVVRNSQVLSQFQRDRHDASEVPMTGFYRLLGEWDGMLCVVA